MKNKRAFPIALFTLSVLAGSIAPPMARAGEDPRDSFIPHRAVYALSLEGGDANGFVAGANGGFEYEWADVCDGWAIRHEAEIFFDVEQGVDLQTGWKVSTWESKAGDALRFFVRRFEDGAQTEAVRGSARLTGDEGGVAEFTEPTEMTLELPPGTYFPTAHWFAMTARLKAPGDSFFATYFDGSSPEEGLTAINAIIQREVETGEAPDLPRPELFAGETGLSAGLAYFPAEEEAAEPLSEQQVVYYDNGIITQVFFDFGDMTIKGELVDLEVLDAPEC